VLVLQGFIAVFEQGEGWQGLGEDVRVVLVVREWWF